MKFSCALCIEIDDDENFLGVAINLHTRVVFKRASL